jgi:cold shock CspA family protein
MDSRINGTLKTWNDSKGFGFITPLNGGQDIFVHVSDYPKRGGPPKVGEPLSFEVTLNKDGKKKAVLVQRPGGEPTAPYRARAGTPTRQENSLLGRLIGVILIGLIVSTGYSFLAPKFNRSSSEPAALVSPTAEPAALISPPAEPAPARFQCDGRTHCSHMTSCAEATYFIRNCPNTEMDGDGDGVPCESQWCTSPFAK